jgi:hypothetical protein
MDEQLECPLDSGAAASTDNPGVNVAPYVGVNNAVNMVDQYDALLPLATRCVGRGKGDQFFMVHSCHDPLMSLDGVVKGNKLEEATDSAATVSDGADHVVAVPLSY